MNKLKQYRNSIGVNQKDLGESVGVGQSTIDRYESGKRKVSVAMAWKLVHALNEFGSDCSFDQVFPNPQQ